MVKKYTVVLSDAEDKALSTVVADQQEWIDNAVHTRCRIAIDEIVNSIVQQKLENGEPITGSKEDIVLNAALETAVERQTRLDNEYKKLLAEQQG